jgi:hypothetical protein
MSPRYATHIRWQTANHTFCGRYGVEGLAPDDYRRWHASPGSEASIRWCLRCTESFWVREKQRDDT